jgi:small subunit ribosomal protein S18
LIRNENSASGPMGGASGPGQGGPGGPMDRSRRPRGRGRYAPRRKVCVFCVDKVTDIDYKDSNRLRRYISDRGKIEPRRKTGTCARHQRILATAIKRARHLALLPFVAEHVRELGGSFGPIRPERRDRFGDRGGFRGDREGAPFGQAPSAPPAQPAPAAEAADEGTPPAGE